VKCPKCSLVTFDNLPKCTRCGQSFHLQRRLTRARTDPTRKIVLPGSERPAPASADRPAPRTSRTAPETETARRSIFAADLAPAAELEEPETVEPEVESGSELDPVDPHAADAARLRTQMIAASQQRRREGPDLVSEAVDPALPDWYDLTSLEDEEEPAKAPPTKR
jgi:hypothetical protein